MATVSFSSFDILGISPVMPAKQELKHVADLLNNKILF
jgi:hypothetical protein